MAKKKTDAVPTPEEAAPLTSEQFLKIAEKFVPDIKGRDRIRQFNAFYALGKMLIEHFPKHSSYGDNQMTKYAEALGYSNGWISKVRRFAAAYNQADFDELLKTNLNFGHIALLLSLEGAERIKYQSEAAKKKWTVAQLQRDLKDRPNVVKRGGQPMKVSDDPGTALRHLVAEGETWKQRCEKTAEQISNKAKMSAKLREQAQDTAAALQATIKVIQGVAKGLAALK